MKSFKLGEVGMFLIFRCCCCYFFVQKALTKYIKALIYSIYYKLAGVAFIWNLKSSSLIQSRLTGPF